MAQPAAAETPREVGPGALRLLDFTDLCDALNLSHSKIKTLLADPAENFPAGFPVGKRQMWSAAAVSAWLASKQPAPPAQAA